MKTRKGSRPYNAGLICRSNMQTKFRYINSKSGRCCIKPSFSLLYSCFSKSGKRHSKILKISLYLRGNNSNQEEI